MAKWEIYKIYARKKKVRIFTIWLLKRIRKTPQKKKKGNKTYNSGFREFAIENIQISGHVKKRSALVVRMS